MLGDCQLPSGEECIQLEEISEENNEIQIVEEQIENRKEVIEWPYRDNLPAERDPNNKPSVWKMLKDMIGKDLSRFAIPVYFNEPLSFIQKFCEALEYYKLIEIAESIDDPKERLL